MSSSITITFDQRGDGIQPDVWNDFYTRRGFTLDRITGRFYNNGVEVEYETAYRIAFSAPFPTVACDDAIMSATELWKQHGGSLTASPELRDVIGDIIFDGMM